MTKVLLTGFEPFAGDAVNASWRAAGVLHQVVIDGAFVVAERISCCFEKTQMELQQLIAQHRPDIVLCLGQANATAAIAVEKVAINYIDARIPDNNGLQPLQQAVVDHGPTAYFATVPVKSLTAALQAHQIEANVSYSAGTFVCNQLFYILMHELASQPHILGGFVHVPACEVQAQVRDIPFMRTEQVVHALRIMIKTLQHSERVISSSMGRLD